MSETLSPVLLSSFHNLQIFPFFLLNGLCLAIILVRAEQPETRPMSSDFRAPAQLNTVMPRILTSPCKQMLRHSSLTLCTAHGDGSHGSPSYLFIMTEVSTYLQTKTDTAPSQLTYPPYSGRKFDGLHGK